jgi:hypothetical protein
MYGDGILRIPGAPTNTTQQSYNLGALFGLGKYWTFNYAFGRTINSSSLIADYTSHTANLSGAVTRGDWTFGISQGYESRAPTLVETGQQTPEKSFNTTATVSYEVGPKTLIDLSVTRSERDSELTVDTPGNPVLDTERWSGTGLFHYRASPRLDVAVGLKLGRDRVSNSTDMNVSEPQFTFNWRPTDKVSISGEYGRESRRFLEGEVQDLKSQVYSASLSYQPAQVTTLTLSGNRQVSPSYFANQLTRNIGWSVNVQQRLLQRLFLSGGYSRGDVTYLAIEQGFGEQRGDSFESYNFGLSTTISRRGSISLSYQRSTNFSSISEFGFTSNQYGMTLSYRF